MILKKGNSETLTATVLPAGSSRKVTWSTSSQGVANVDSNGKITAVGAGKAVITATLSGTAITAQCSVTVTEDPENTPVEVSVKDIHIVGLNESYPYTGSAIKPEIQVYDGDTRLVAGIDYTISYKNNTKAANKNSSKAPVIVIKGKGLYSDSHEERFTISAIDINEASAEEITMVQTAKPKKLTVKAKVTWEGKTLKEKTDYTIDYNGWDQMSTGDHQILLKGTGNYTGVKQIIVHVLGASSEETPVTKLKVTSKAVTYRNGLTMDEVIGNVTVKDGKTELVDGRDYTVSDVNNWDKPGTCTFVITGSGKYVGSRTVSVKINGTPLSKLTVTGSTTYDGSAKTLKNSGITVKCNGATLAENKDFIVTGYSNNINAGKASATIEGIGAYSGKATVNFTISPDTGAKSVEVSSAEYSKGGAIPRVTVKSGTTLLREFSDYTMKVSNNKAADKEGTVTVSFIGNYKSAQKVTKNFRITKKDISDVTVSAADPVWKSKSPKWQAAISVYDTDGKKLAAKTDYVIVRYENALTGEEITNASQVDQNTQIRAIIEGVKNYTGTSSVTYGFTVAANDLSKAKVTVNPASWDYTGNPIEPSGKQIVVTFGNGKKLTEGVDYQIVGFSNNVNKGTANVIVEGIGNYSGVKVGTFKIVQRSMKRSWNDEVLRIVQELFW